MVVSMHDRVLKGGRAVVAAVVAIVTSSLAHSSAAQQRPRFEAAVGRVLVDAIVTDSDGEFVDDLTLDDFLVFEDGRPQQLLSAEFISTTSVAATSSEFEDGRATEAGSPTGFVSPNDEPTSPPGFGDAGAVVFIVDLPSLDPRRRARFVDAWESILAETSSPNVPRAVYVIDQGFRVRELAPLSRDVSRLRSAAREIRDIPVIGRSLKDFLIGIDDDLQPDQRAQRKVRAFEERARSIASLKTLTSFCESLLAARGRIALVWVSSGALLRPRQVEGEMRPGPDSLPNFDATMRDPQIAVLQDSLHRAANSANVSIYSVDPGRGIDRDPSSTDVRRRDTVSLAEMASRRRLLHALAEPLRDASDATAG